MSTYQRILQNKSFRPPENWPQIGTIDMHTGGEPLRAIMDGFPDIPGDNVLARSGA